MLAFMSLAKAKTSDIHTDTRHTHVRAQHMRDTCVNTVRGDEAMARRAKFCRRGRISCAASHLISNRAGALAVELRVASAPPCRPCFSIYADISKGALDARRQRDIVKDGHGRSAGRPGS